MLEKPKCLLRRCKRYLGVIQLDSSEITEVNFCKAFPEGIPFRIAYGNDIHLTVSEDQTNDIVFEKE